ncbi:tetratricopeptide repeat protein [Tenacibaculum xiamenense]|uniref:tetratricopeptide repeat protein n=1 Tax=Tenacibaculum xiamenense TaxID=1261553 RepID=UPI003896402F
MGKVVLLKVYVVACLLISFKSVALEEVKFLSKSQDSVDNSKVLKAYYSFQKKEDPKILDSILSYLKVNNIQIKEDSINSKALYLKAVNNYVLRRYDVCEQFLKESLRLAEKTQDIRLIGVVYNMRGLNVTQDTGDFVKAEEYLKKAIVYFKATGEKFQIIDTYYNLFMNSRRRKEWKLVLKYADTCISLIQKTGARKRVLKTIYIRKAHSYSKLGDFNAALTNLKKAEDNITAKDRNERNLLNYAYAEYHMEKKEFEQAAKRYKMTRDSVAKLNFETQKLLGKSFERELELEGQLKADKDKIIQSQNRSLFFGGIALVVLIVLVFVLVYNSKRNGKKNMEIVELNNSLNRLIEELKGKNISLEEKRMEVENFLRLNEQSLFSRVLKISTYNDTIRKISAEIDNYMDMNPSASGYLMTVRKKLNILISEEELWDDFKVQFEKIRPEFFNKLKRVAPDLSVNDLKHCTYVVSNLKSKEVAQLINVSPRSVETTRYRIKKKIGLEKDDSLYDLLSNL